MYKIYNQIFQPMQILYKGDTLILPKRGRKSYKRVEFLNDQIKRLEKRKLIKIKVEK